MECKSEHAYLFRELKNLPLKIATVVDGQKFSDIFFLIFWTKKSRTSKRFAIACKIWL